MLIPLEMTNKISKYFYDKTVSFYTSKRETSLDGGRGEVITEVKNSIKCNVKPVTAEILKESFGLSIDASLLLTCSTNEDVNLGFCFDLYNQSYEVVEVLKYDSHLKVLCK